VVASIHVQGDSFKFSLSSDDRNALIDLARRLEPSLAKDKESPIARALQHRHDQASMIQATIRGSVERTGPPPDPIREAALEESEGVLAAGGSPEEASEAAARVGQGAGRTVEEVAAIAGKPFCLSFGSRVMRAVRVCAV